MSVVLLTESATDAEFLKWLLSEEVAAYQLQIKGVPGKTSAISLARTILSRTNDAVALLVDADSTTERRIQEDYQLVEYMLKSASHGQPIHVVLAKPCIETFALSSEEFLLRHFKKSLRDEDKIIARYDAKLALRQSFDMDIRSFLKAVGSTPPNELRQHEDIQKLIRFIHDVRQAEAQAA